MAKIPTKITARIEYWESKGFPKMVKKTTKTYKQTVEKLAHSINGTSIFAGKKYSMQDFRLAVDRHALETFDPRYLPFSKTYAKKMTLNDFLFNSFATGINQSSLKRCFTYHPLPISKKDPKIYDMLIPLYIKESNNGIKVADDLTADDHNNLAQASNKISKFWDTRNAKLEKVGTGTKKDLAVLLIKAAKSFTKYNSEIFCSGLLTRKWVWEKFPNYLDQNGFLAPNKPFNIYDY